MAIGIGMILSGCVSSGGYDPVRSEWDQGMWRPPKSQEAGREPSAEKLRSESREAFDSQAYQDALRGYLALRDHYPKSRESSDVGTSFLIAECYYQLGEREYSNAYRYYLEVLKGNPPEKMLQTTLDRIYDIGIAFLHGRAKKSFLGFRYRSPSFGIEILTGDQGLVTNYPFLKSSEDALMEVGKYHFQERDYAEAEKVYEKLVRDYPQSRWNDAAEFQQALAIRRQIRGVDYDQAAIRKARVKFNAYLVHHPRGDQVDEARRHLREIAEMEGQHDLKIAKYYLRESQPKAAILYLQSVFINHPKTDAAREANEIYENLEKKRKESGR